MFCWEDMKHLGTRKLCAHLNRLGKPDSLTDEHAMAGASQSQKSHNCNNLKNLTIATISKMLHRQKFGNWGALSCFGTFGIFADDTIGKLTKKSIQHVALIAVMVEMGVTYINEI